MKKLLSLVFLLTVGVSFSQSFWGPATSVSRSQILANPDQVPTDQIMTLDVENLKRALVKAPKRGLDTSKSGIVISFPNADGTMERFMVKEASTMHPALAAKFPNIKSYAGQGIDDPSAVIRFSVSHKGLNSMVLSGVKPATFIQPYTKDGSQYTIYKRQDRPRTPHDFECLVDNKHTPQLGASTERNADDGLLRTFRIAISAQAEYTQYHGGTVADALAAINTTMTRVNGVFEVDFGMTTVIVANNDQVIYTDPATDPYTGSFNSQAQQTLDNVIGDANYDIGHVFVQGGNSGSAGFIGEVCTTGRKGSAFTSRTNPEGDPFDIDFVAHEIGHQLGANHTWTHGGNEGTGAQMEPGSGTTIMGYAGITGPNTDVQPNSDPYFHAFSIQQVLINVRGESCQVETATGNAVPTADAGADVTIPAGTPFVLEGGGSDADGNSLTFCWEQFDSNNAQTTIPNANNTSGVAFRSFNPTADTKRYFPRLETIKTGATGWRWEQVPAVSRALTFRLTVRDNVAGGGANNSDDVTVNVTASAGPFVVNSPNTATTWFANQTRTVSWDVAGTTGNGINAANVDIFLSTDGGDTYPISLATNVANDGSHDIIVPNEIGTQNRIMVKASNNVFFDISDADFSIEGEVNCVATTPTNVAASNITSSTATITWDQILGASFDVRYRQTGTTAWTDQTVSDNTISISGLTEETSYEVQVRSTCSDNGPSDYSASINFTTTNVQLNYCDSQGNRVNDEWIARVQLGDIDNSSDNSLGGYSDFKAISTTLNQGDNYTITITPEWRSTTYREGYSVWIDYNRDGDFDDAGEQVFTQNATTSTPVSGSFSVPSGTSTGLTAMRVSMKYNSIPTACETFTYGEVEDYGIILSSGVVDEEAPTAPANLTAANTGETTTDLSWDASTDNVAVSGYDVYQDGSLITTVPGTSYNVTGLAAETTYEFYVIARDAAGNSSAQSNTVSVTTEAPFVDTEAPTAPANLTAGNTGETTTDLSWDASTDNVAVTGYNVYQDGALVVTVTGTSYGVTGLTAETTYDFYVTARDAANNESAQSNTISVTTDAPFVDTEAPTAPTNLAAANITQTSTDLSWDASTDNVAVTAYDVYQDGSVVGTVSGTSYTASGLTADTAYTFTVIAKDAAGNESTASNAVNVTTLPAGGGSDLLFEGFFETGFDGWIDGGSDCARYAGSRSFEGTYSIRLRDNSGVASSMTSPGFNLAPYQQIEFKFYFYANSMENGEDFWLLYDDGSGFTTVATYARGTDFENGIFYEATVNLNAGQVNLTNGGRFRLQCDATANGDQVYIDQVTITGINGASSRGYAQDTINFISRLDENANLEDFEAGFNVYPNPVKGNELFVTLPDSATGQYRIMNLIGQTVKSGTTKSTAINVSKLRSGVYIIEVNDGEELIRKKLVKQ
ncbi:reprolysin-like metallopeptidase [Spongiivirga sp. MCCC 1A20706]|uniref:fibronectin type III domain-containing protein n=1 Tax=Spongiivirga sp. MCCC 1A20706 TaxID=3160963 RepID=UPI003977B000